ncbi:MAG: ComF family protein [Thermodesulfobacteriota bacterium]|nr:ComF family protein [Thermodesulfobacteriota bacterium]
MGGFVIVRQLLWQLFKLFFPPACPLCSRTLPNDSPKIFCADCWSGFRPLSDAHCPLCALPFTGISNSSHLCGRCIKQLPTYEKVYAVGLYETSLRRAIHQFKFNHKVSLDRSLGKLLEQAVDSNLHIDLVVPVPLHRKRLQQRNYNQALLLAREFARIRKVPVANDLLLKVNETNSQQGLSAKERVKNLQGAFTLQGAITGKTILLVDDVMTTGATVETCSQVLIAGGAVKIYVAVIGRAA